MMLKNQTLEVPKYILKFPEIDFRLSALESYAGTITESILFIHEQKCQRLRAQINSFGIDSEEDIEDQAILSYELECLEENGIENISHTIWGGVLISIFSTFENSINQILVYCHAELLKPKFERINKQSFIRSVHAYSVTNLEIGLFNNELDVAILTDLTQLRNSYVHNGCKIDSLPKRLHDVIIEEKYGDYSMAIKDGTWLANEKNTIFYLRHTKECLQSYQDQVLRLASEN